MGFSKVLFTLYTNFAILPIYLYAQFPFPNRNLIGKEFLIQGRDIKIPPIVIFDSGIQGHYIRRPIYRRSPRPRKLVHPFVSLAGAIRDSNPHEVYDKIAFYNFFQKSIGEGNHADKRYLTKELKEVSAKALAEVMEVLQPDLIVGWGWSDLEWKYLPQSRNQIDINKDCAGIHLHLFTLNVFPKIPIWCMHHPSMGINIDAHRTCFAEIKRFLNW